MQDLKHSNLYWRRTYQKNFLLLLYTGNTAMVLIIIPPQNEYFWGYTGISLPVHVSVRVSIFVQKTGFCQSTGRGIKSYLATVLVFIQISKDRTYYGITCGGRRPVLCLEHILKTILAMVMKFCGWIDLIKGECIAHEP